jgi:hypothetical protein
VTFSSKGKQEASSSLPSDFVPAQKKLHPIKKNQPLQFDHGQLDIGQVKQNVKPSFIFYFGFD